MKEAMGGGGGVTEKKLQFEKKKSVKNRNYNVMWNGIWKFTL